MKILKSVINALKFVYQYVFSYISAKFGPRTDFKTYVDRLNVCKDCSWKIDKGNYSFCASCFCPRHRLWSDAILWNKARFKNSKCPKHKWEVHK